ncbi:MAG: hypothetical protein IJT16_02380 [Lachnospiraceae bacterium]|nr:hypothetical protein [Lachnospiraceae bacterium]
MILLILTELSGIFQNASSPVGRTEAERAPLAGFLIPAEGLTIEEGCTPELLGSGVEVEAISVRTAPVNSTGSGRLLLRLFFLLLWAAFLYFACLQKTINRSLAFCGDSCLCLVLRYIHNNDGKK